VDDTAYEGVPRSFVLKAGTLGASAQTLVRDVRTIMQPYTAVRLRVRQMRARGAWTVRAWHSEAGGRGTLTGGPSVLRVCMGLFLCLCLCLRLGAF
jgi:hypothetical protein